LYYLTDCNDKLVKEWMTTVEKTSKLDLDPSWLARLQCHFRAARVTDEEMCGAIRMVREKYGYTVDPHTACAVAAAESLGYALSASRERPVAILSTASPCKFQESVTVALGEDGWKNYAANEFPESGKAVMMRDEIEPTFYVHGADWETLARNIVAELGQIDESN
jgi:threonine synthase